jgi:hypothetical protein
MDISDKTDNSLEKLVLALQARVDKLESDQRRLVKAILGSDDVQTEFRKLTDRDVAYAFERIANVEKVVFPNLGADVAQLTDIIGHGNGKAQPHRVSRAQGKA